jgi:hypothetical protein
MKLESRYVVIIAQGVTRRNHKAYFLIAQTSNARNLTALLMLYL